MSSPTTNWEAALYDQKHSFVWKYGAEVVDLLAPKVGELILDLGCGTGHLTHQIASLGAQVEGIDASEAMIQEARRNYPGISFEVVDARQIQFNDRFDAVFSNAVLHWIPEAGQVAQAICRSLKPGGRFVAEFGGHGNVKRLRGALNRTLHAMVGVDAHLLHYYPSIAEYAKVLEQAGLEVTFATLFDRPTPLVGEQGIRTWATMFGDQLLQQVPLSQRESYFEAVETELRPHLYREGIWYADYRRLRLVARRVS